MTSFYEALFHPVGFDGLPEHDRIPPKTPEIIAKDLRLKIPTDQIYVLAYSSEMGDILIREIYNLLLAVKMENGHWQLLKVVRSWGSLGERLEWTIEINVADNASAKREYSKVPTLADIEDFFKFGHWKFEAGRGRFLVEGEVYPEAWKKAFGFEPAFRFYDPQSEIGKPISAESILRSIRYSSEATGYLLSTKTSKDNPDDHLESALFLVDLKDGYWQLGWVERFRVHPRESRRYWQFRTVRDAWIPLRQSYSHVPTEAEVNAFLKVSHWEGQDDSPTSENERIFEETWFKILKFRPKYKFEKITP